MKTATRWTAVCASLMGSACAPIVLAAWCSLVSVAAGQTGWPSTFEPAVLSTYVEPGRRIMVVPAGQSGGLGDAAATAITRGLEQAGAALVMDASALSDVSGMDDATIVAKAQPYPVDLVLIVRGFGGTGGASSSVVAVAYSKSGQAAFAFNAREGTPLSPAQPPRGAAPESATSRTRADREGERDAAGPGVAAAQNETSAYEERAKVYKEQFLHFGETVYVNGATGVIVGSRSDPFQGQYRKPLAWPEFFETADRRDLADEYRRRRRNKRIMILSGLAGLGLGITTFTIPLTSRGYCFDDEPDCDDSINVAPVVIGTVVAAGGIALTLTGIIRSKMPVEMSDARRVADEHNQKLRQKLGLDDQLEVSPPKPTGRAAQPGMWDRLSIAPTASRSGGGLQLKLQL